MFRFSIVVLALVVGVTGCANSYQKKAADYRHLEIKHRVKSFGGYPDYPIELIDEIEKSNR